MTGIDEKRRVDVLAVCAVALTLHDRCLTKFVLTVDLNLN